jgi:hypothetical protein
MNNEELRQLALAATPGPWHHCQPFMTLPAQRTVHGPVPAERVDYVSTWHGMGTPTGHSIVIGSAGRESQVRSKDMAFISAANPAAVLELLDENNRLGDALVYIGNICIRHDRGDEMGRVLGRIADHARAALEPKAQKERRAKALSDLAEMDADLLDIDPGVKP